MMAFSFGAGGRVLLIITHLLLIWTDHTLADVTTDLTTADPSGVQQTTADPSGVQQTTPDTSLVTGGGAGEAKGRFIEPVAITPNVEVVAYKGKEYLMVDIKVSHDFAEMMCPSYYSATLATIPNLELAQELSDALAETTLEYESLWIGGKNSSSGSWNWMKSNQSEVISDEILQLIGNTVAAADLERHCLAFAREHHQKPQFKNLDCFVDRPFMCERARGSSEGNLTTHPGWILIGTRLYKIFNDKVDYFTAGMNCFAANPNATLAILDNMDDVIQLARYLLIGRPSLENAWIGARWIQDKYEFEADSSIILGNTTNATSGFPPWRDNEMQRTGGCLLLDRHLTDTPLFVETRCPRLRSYVCSRPALNVAKELNYTQTQFEDRVYRAYFHAQPWAAAQATCLADLGKLVEPTGEQTVKELLYIMGQNVTTFNHIWLGGRYIADQWTWDSSKSEIDTKLFPFVQNNTYAEVIEQMNTCLNMDRENHIVSLFYGTNCFYPQYFVCILDSGASSTP